MKRNPKHASIKHISKLIEREVSFFQFFNGWWVSEEALQKACQKAAIKVRRYLRQWRS